MLKSDCISLIQERQEFEAWRASRAQANLQPQPQITSAGQVKGSQRC